MREYVPPEGSIPTLEVPDLSDVRSAHLVGIGGAGMSGIARLLLADGVRVSGSDLKDSPGLGPLRDAGARVAVGHRSGNLDGPDVVVVSTAIPSGNVEVGEARARGIPVLARAQVLAALMARRRGIAVAGAHGKTTTTSMIAVILERAGLDPTYVIGGDLNESGSNARSGAGPHFVAEADESDGSFLLLRPELAVVTNVEADHLDFYADAEEIEAAYAAFCKRAGKVIACGDDAGAARVLEGTGIEAVTYGERSSNAVRVETIRVEPEGSGCSLGFEGGTTRLSVPVPGRHHLLNAAAAVTVAVTVGIEPGEAAEALGGYKGVRRRFERRGVAGGAGFIDDYAHHPTEIRATLAGARADRPRRLVAVFQPHRYSRTAAMWRSLGESLAGADVVVVTDVYGAGEMPVPGISGKLLVDALLEAAPTTRTIYLPSRADVAPFLSAEVREGDLVLTLGAGDVTMVGEEAMARIREADGHA